MYFHFINCIFCCCANNSNSSYPTIFDNLSYKGELSNPNTTEASAKDDARRGLNIQIETAGQPFLYIVSRFPFWIVSLEGFAS